MIASKFARERFRASATGDITNHVIYCKNTTYNTTPR
jgi:hypothetical protein